MACLPVREGQLDGIGERPRRQNLHAWHHDGLAPTGPRHDGAVEAQPRGLAQAALQPADGAKFAQQPHLTNGNGARADGPIPKR